MAKLFTITDDIRAIGSNAIDDLIDQLGKDCRLVYPPTLVPCSDCAADPIGDKPANAWVTGGAFSPPDGTVCAMCGGSQYRAEETT